MARANPAPRPSATPVWIVVADAGRARIFQAQNNDGALTELTDLVNPEARLQDHDSTSGRAGSSSLGGLRRGSNALSGHRAHADNAAESFARKLCRHLSAARRRGVVARMYIVAAPVFLGLIRQHLDKPTQRIVAQTLATDIVRRTPGVIRRTLPARL